MIGRIKAALHARRAAIREAEILVGAFGARGVAMAEGLAEDPHVRTERRAHFGKVAHHARRRNDILSSLDTASRHVELGRMSGKL